MWLDGIGTIHWDMAPADAIAQAHTYWQSGHLLYAGRMLYERVPRRLRPEWAASVLRAASEFAPRTAEIKAVLAFAEHPEQWGDGAEDKRRQAHYFFGATRLLALKSRGKDDLFENVLTLAENVAKVTYNAYGYAAPFDHHAGWIIGAAFLSVVEQVKDDEFATKAWAILSDEKYITLTTPEICHPRCSDCYIWCLGS